MTDLPLITKYRPVSFKEVLGNQQCVKALSEAIHSPSRPHAFLFTGSSGIGKTTLARIIASEIDASTLEIDAASHSGVDDIRSLVELSGFKPISIQPNRLYIVDECHSLSKQAWQPLLKLLEDPPEYLYIALCTTELQKVPETVKTRCYPVALKPLKIREIEDLLLDVSEIEGWTVTPDTMNGIVHASDGSARKALSILQVGHTIQTRDELSKMIADVESDSSPVIELCLYLLKGGTNWKVISPLIEKIEDEEEAIFQMSRFFVSRMTKSEEEQAKQIYVFLRSISETNTWDKKTHFYSAIGKILWGQLPF